MNTVFQKIKLSNNNDINSILYSCNSAKCVILCHGFPGDKLEHGRFEKTAKILTKYGYDVFSFDFPGYGENKREPVMLSKQIASLEYIGEWLIHKGYKKLATIGLSLGGLTVLFSNLPKHYVSIYWAPAFYIYKTFGKFIRGISILNIKALKTPMKIKSSSLKYKDIILTKHFFKEIFKLNDEEIGIKLKKKKTDSLIIQGNLDIIATFKHNQKAFLKMNKRINKGMIMVKNASHNFDGKKLNTFIKFTLEWLNKYFK